MSLNVHSPTPKYTHTRLWGKKYTSNTYETLKSFGCEFVRVITSSTLNKSLVGSVLVYCVWKERDWWEVGSTSKYLEWLLQAYVSTGFPNTKCTGDIKSNNSILMGSLHICSQKVECCSAILQSSGAVLTNVLYLSCCFSYSSILHLSPFWSSGNPPKCITMDTRYPHLLWGISELQQSEKNWNNIHKYSLHFILSVTGLEINKNIVCCFKDSILLFVCTEVFPFLN